jgi:L-rhamnose isomerase
MTKEEYIAIGVNTDEALIALNNITLSFHCRQTYDYGSFVLNSSLFYSV